MATKTSSINQNIETLNLRVHFRSSKVQKPNITLKVIFKIVAISIVLCLKSQATDASRDPVGMDCPCADGSDAR